MTLESEPRNRYVDAESGKCWSISCTRPATHILLTRAEPDESFPQGLLIEAGYCWEDAVWFAGKTVVEGRAFISLTEIDQP